MKTIITHMYIPAIDYSDVVELLQQKIITYIRLNPSLNKHVRYKSRFVENKPQAIEFNFHEFSDTYQAAHIAPDLKPIAICLLKRL